MAFFDKIKKIGNLVYPRSSTDRDSAPLATLSETYLTRPPLSTPPQPTLQPSPRNVMTDTGDDSATENDVYSHGMEKIYALEKVDLTTVRRLSVSPKEKKPEEATPKRLDPLWDEPEQLELDLGPPFRGWMESFALDEPVQVLELSSPAEKCLLNIEKRFLRDLAHGQLEALAKNPGMGQGHIDEVGEKLVRYLGGQDVRRCRILDFTQWLRSLTAGCELKGVRLVADQFGLGGLYPLSMRESVELRRLTEDKNARKEVDLALTQEVTRLRFDRKRREILEVFVKPWIRRRQGIATAAEVEERVLRISTDPKQTQAVLQWLAELYGKGECLFTEGLIRVEPDLFAADRWAADLAQELIQQIQSYFYAEHCCYSLPELVQFIERERAPSWTSVPTPFVEKVIRTSSRFHVSKGERGALMVTTASLRVS